MRLRREPVQSRRQRRAHGAALLHGRDRVAGMLRGQAAVAPENEERDCDVALVPPEWERERGVPL
jgi:hypothetical protein